MAAFLICLVIIAAVLQSNMATWALRALDCSLKADTYLLEPGETSVITFTVINHSRLPVLFLKASFTLPPNAEVLEGQPGEVINFERYTRYTYSCYLMPRQQLAIPVKYRIPSRSVCNFGGCTLYTGDFLGLKEESASYPASATVVVPPARLDNTEAAEITGGLMGDISVRRFIHQDPVLTAGFREYSGREPMKDISWPRSLASGQLMVRQFDFTSEQKVTILLSVSGGDEAQLERCFSLTRTVCDWFEKRGVPYSLMSNGDLYSTIGRINSLPSGLGHMHLDLIKEGLGRATYLSRFSFDELIRLASLINDVPETYLVIAPDPANEIRRSADILTMRTGAPVQVLSGEAAS